MFIMEIKCYVVLICCFKDDSAMMGIKDLANDLIIFCPLYLYKDEYNNCFILFISLYKDDLTDECINVLLCF